MLNIEIIRCLKDNYSYLIHEADSNLVAVVDPSEFKPVDDLVRKKYKKIDFIFNTHHHFDHVGGNEDLKKKYNSQIVASFIDQNKIPGIDISVKDNEIFKFGKIDFNIILIPGHTKGHIAFYSKKNKIIFTGDTLFSLGCGRVFEGTLNEMFDSINKIKALPNKTKVYFGHEYTKSNLEFCIQIEKNNIYLRKKSEWINSKINNNLPTSPSTIEEELKTNVFLRCKNIDIKSYLKMIKASDQEIFNKLRDLKDKF